ncbi:hypothetical protein J3R82DRAFT_10418 [Butyriboletus roseoflavus]|nr:hypothetical protein J3R82DRAFT_10418 [Butyriboletus roseoflavus]
MTDRRGYSFPTTTDLDRGSHWPASTPRYHPPSSTHHDAPPGSAYPLMEGTAHNLASVHPSIQYGVGNYTGDYPPSASSQYTAPTPDTYHQPRQTYPLPNHTHQSLSAVPQYTVASQQYPAPHHQPTVHQNSPYYARGDSPYGQSQYPAQYPASPSRPFSCDLCALSFNRQHDLKRHRETHSGEKPFLCNGGCGKTFTRKDALKRHQACLFSPSSDERTTHHIPVGEALRARRRRVLTTSYRKRLIGSLNMSFV